MADRAEAAVSNASRKDMALGGAAGYWGCAARWALILGRLNEARTAFENAARFMVEMAEEMARPRVDAGRWRSAIEATIESGRRSKR